jgi:hypothetical protein
MWGALSDERTGLSFTVNDINDNEISAPTARWEWGMGKRYREYVYLF